MSKVYTFFATGFEEVEALTVVDLLRRAGVSVNMVSVTGEDTVVGSHNIGINMDSKFDDNDYSDGDLFFLPGGMPGTTNLLAHEGLCKLLVSKCEEGRRLAAVCAAPSVFGQLELLKGKKATCYPGFEDKLLGADTVTDSVVTDGNITTSRGMGTSIDLGLELITLLCDEETAITIGKGIIYK